MVARIPSAKHAAAALIALVALSLVPGAARALRYKPKPDESLSHIAMIHYGAAKKSVYIGAANTINDPTKLQQYKSLWVPTVWKYRIKRGDDLAKLARKYLKDSSRAEFLAWLNQIKDPKDIKVGAWITMPFLLRHRVQEGQTIVDLAKRYYFTTQPAGLLRKFNSKRTNALKPGELILVPIYDPEAAVDKVKQRLALYEERVAKEAQDARERALREAAAKAKEREDKQTQQPEEAGRPVGDQVDPIALPVAPDDDPTAVLEDPRTEPDGKEITPQADSKLIREAFDLYRDGEYEMARANLTRVLEAGRLARSDEAEAREVLAHCLVAMEQIKEAEHEFVRLLMVAPDRSLDPVTTSPKVLEVFRRARGSK